MATDKRKSLTILLDLKQKELDSLRQRQQQLLAQQESFRQDQLALQQRLEMEEQAAAGDIQMIRYLAQYRQVNKDAQKQLQQAIERLEGQLQMLREQLYAAFVELKKVEKIREGMDARIMTRLKQIENQLMDELGLRGHKA